MSREGASVRHRPASVPAPGAPGMRSCGRALSESVVGAGINSAMFSRLSESMKSHGRGVARPAALALCAVLLFGHGAAKAQDRGTLNPQPLPPLTKANGP